MHHRSHLRSRLFSTLFALGIFIASHAAQAGVILVGDSSPDGDGAPAFACGDAANPCDTIQNGISVATPGDTLQIAAGNFTENVVVDKPLTLQGAGVGQTNLFPSLSNPNCNSGSLCGGAASSVVLVQANDVVVRDLAVDGDNPASTSGIVVGGADIDARNGIIVNFLVGNFNNLEVGNVAVRNVFLRGIQVSDGSGFNIHDNTVDNVQGSSASISIFLTSASGIARQNSVSHCNDAIASNYSSGIQFLDNQVSNCSTGLHTDNAGGAGGTPPVDLIQGNTVQDCVGPMGATYGISVFVPSEAVQVKKNTIKKCDVGLGLFGQAEGLGSPVYPEFSSNDLQDNDTGVVVTTNSNFSNVTYSTNVHGLFTSNNIVNSKTHGFFFEAQVLTDPISLPLVASTGTFSVDVKASFNRIVGSGTAGAVTNPAQLGDYTVSMENNWWGCNAGPNDAAGACDAVQGSAIDFDPWLVLELGANPGSIAKGDTSNLQIDLTKNSQGMDTSSAGKLPDGVTVSFAVDLGSIAAPGTVGTGSGIANAIYQANGGAGLATATATVDGQTVSAPIQVQDKNPPPTTPSGSGPSGVNAIEGSGCSLQTAAPWSFSLWGSALLCGFLGLALRLRRR